MKCRRRVCRQRAGPQHDGGSLVEGDGSNPHHGCHVGVQLRRRRRARSRLQRSYLSLALSRQEHLRSTQAAVAVKRPSSRCLREDGRTQLCLS